MTESAVGSDPDADDPDDDPLAFRLLPKPSSLNFSSDDRPDFDSAGGAD
jgi:hypothetical protein